MNNIQDIIRGIENGNADTGLGLIIAACRQRQNGINPPMDHSDDGHELAQSYYSQVRIGAPNVQYRVGMKVRFNNKCRPVYMRGMVATITKVNQVRVQVRLDVPAGRFGDGVINCPTSILEAI